MVFTKKKKKVLQTSAKIVKYFVITSIYDLRNSSVSYHFEKEKVQCLITLIK